MDPDMASLIQSGCSEKIKAPLLIVEIDDSGNTSYIRPINPRQYFTEFCLNFREENRLDIVGGDEACKEFDAYVAETFLNKKISRCQNVKEEDNLIKELAECYGCHLGLVDMYAPIIVAGKPVAIIYSGQRKPGEKKEARIYEKIDQIGTDECKYCKSVQITDSARSQLKSLVNNLKVHDQKYLDELKAEAKLISSFAKKEYELNKSKKQTDFIAKLLDSCYKAMNENHRDINDILENINKILDMIREFCGTSYIAFFSWKNEDTGDLLDLVGSSGIRQHILEYPPHFNWQKAGFPPQDKINKTDEEILSDLSKIIKKGIRSDKDHSTDVSFFHDVSCAFPIVLSGMYKAILLFGPFEKERDVMINRELSFLRQLADSIGYRFLMQLMSFEAQRKENMWRDIADLIAHEVGNRAQPLSSEINLCQYFLGDNKPNYTKEDAQKALNNAEKMLKDLSSYSSAAFHVYRARLHRNLNISKCSVYEIAIELRDEFRDYAKKRI